MKPPLPPVPKKNKQLMLTAPPDVLRNYMELARIEFTPRQPETPAELSKTPSLVPLPGIGQRFVEGRAAASPDSASSSSSRRSSKPGLKEEDEDHREKPSSRERGDGREEEEGEASIGGSRMSVVGEEEEEEEGGLADDEGEEGLGGFFMTQDEDAEEKIFSPREGGVESGKQNHIIEREALISGKSSSHASAFPPPPPPPPCVVPPNFRGFEVFLDGADERIDPGFPEWHRNIQTNVANMKAAIGRANAFVPVKRQRLEKVYPVRFRRGGGEGGEGGGGGAEFERDMTSGKQTRSERREFLSPTTPSCAPQQQQQQLPRQQQQQSRSQRRPKSETIMEALRTMKSGVPKMAEDKLRSTLEENARTPRRNQKFPEAEALLSRVQKQYNHVRVESLQDTLEAKDAIMSALRRMEKVLEHEGEK